MAKDSSKISYTEGMLVGYRHFDTNRIQVRYPFGYGLSYTAFESRVAGYEAFGSVIKVCVKVKNVGSVYAGKHVVGIYAGRKENLDNEEAAPRRSLIGFEKQKRCVHRKKQRCFWKFRWTGWGHMMKMLM